MLLNQDFLKQDPRLILVSCILYNGGVALYMDYIRVHANVSGVEAVNYIHVHVHVIMIP